MSGWLYLATQTGHKTPQIDQLTDQVTITDTAHPLFGRIFPLVRSASPRGREGLVVLLPDGQHRTVPVKATDFQLGSYSTVNGLDHPPLPVISVRTILPLARLVRAKLALREEKSDEPAPPPFGADSTPIKPSTPSLSAETVVSIEPNATTTISPTPGAIDPSSARPVQSQSGEGS